MNCFPAETKNRAVDNFRKPIRNKGFTLIEVAIVIAIIGIVAGFAIPAFINYRSGAKLRGAAVNLNADLQRARFLAIKHNRFSEIEFLPDKNKYIITYMYSDRNAAGEINDITKKIEKFMPPGVTLNTGIIDKKAQFDGRGMPIGDHHGIVTLKNTAGKTTDISVDRLGVVKIISS